MNRFNRSVKPDWVAPHSVKLLDQVRERVRHYYYSLPAKEGYVYWAKAVGLKLAAGTQPVR